MSAAVKLDEQPAVSPNGQKNGNALQDTLHLPTRLPRRLVWRESLRKVWGYFVVKNVDDGTYAVSKATARLFIGTLLTVAVAVGVGMLWQRDEITRLRTLAEVQQKTNESLKSDVDQAKNWAQTAKGDYRELQGKFDQFALDYATRPSRKEEPRQ